MKVSSSFTSFSCNNIKIVLTLTVDKVLKFELTD
jgi:hypothetical protein